MAFRWKDRPEYPYAIEPYETRQIPATITRLERWPEIESYREMRLVYHDGQRIVTDQYTIRADTASAAGETDLDAENVGETGETEN